MSKRKKKPSARPGPVAFEPYEKRFDWPRNVCVAPAREQNSIGTSAMGVEASIDDFELKLFGSEIQSLNHSLKDEDFELKLFGSEIQRLNHCLKDVLHKSLQDVVEKDLARKKNKKKKPKMIEDAVLYCGKSANRNLLEDSAFFESVVRGLEEGGILSKSLESGYVISKEDVGRVL